MTHVFNRRSRTFQRKHRARAAVGVQLNIDGVRSRNVQIRTRLILFPWVS